MRRTRSGSGGMSPPAALPITECLRSHAVGRIMAAALIRRGNGLRRHRRSLSSIKGTKEIEMTMSPGSRVDVDAELVDALRRDDPDAAEQLVERFGDRVYQLARRIIGCNEDAEEVAQGALWTAARKIGTFKGEPVFGSWLYRIAANAAYQKLRGRPGKAREVTLADVLPAFDGNGRHFEPIADWSERVDEGALTTELLAVLERAINCLPPDYRTALVMHDVEGFSNSDIAETLGISLPAAKSRVHRARLWVRKQLAEYVHRADRREVQPVPTKSSHRPDHGGCPHPPGERSP